MNGNVFIIKGDSNTQLNSVKLNAVEYLVEQHNENKVKLSLNPAVDGLNANHVVCSSFANEKLNKMDSLDRKKATHHTNNPLRSFLYVSVNVRGDKKEQEFLNAVEIFITKYNSPKYILYPDINYSSNRIWHFVVKLERLVDKEQYNALMQFLLKELNVVPTKTKMKNLLNVTKPLPVPIYSTNESSLLTQFNDSAKGLLIEDSFFEKLGIESDGQQVAPTITYSEEKLAKAIQSFPEQPNYIDVMHNDANRKSFFTSVYVTADDHIIHSSFIEEVIDAVSNNETEKGIYREEYEQVKKEVEKYPSKRLGVQPLSTFLPLYERDTEPLNIAEQLLNHLGEKFVPDPKLELFEACQMIASVYPPSIVKQAGTDKNNVVIFNPLTGVWTHDEDLFYSLLTAIRPYSTIHQLDTLMRTFGAQARNANRFIRPYSGSRYLLFKNGVVDIQDLTLHSVVEPFVRHLHFTERNQLNVNYEYEPQLPIIQNGRIAGGDWNPKDFIYAYGDNDEEKVRFFLFGLSLGLFGGHNFGVHFNLQGESRWGKTTLSEIYNHLYDNRTVITSFSALNGRFPFTSYSLSTSVIWIKECNIGTEPLNEDNGTVIYDGLADSQVRFEVKGGNDIVLENPPQVFIDGTQLIQAKEINTGPAGRTLAYKLPTMTKELRNQAYANNITEAIYREDVTQWLVFEMLKAYRSIIPTNRRSDLKLNLSFNGDLDLLPAFAQEWRCEFSNESSDLDTWFVQEIEDFLSKDTSNPTILHTRILYELYSESYKRTHPQDKMLHKIKDYDNFHSQIHKVLEQRGWLAHAEGTASNKRSKTLRKRIGKVEKLNFDFDGYGQSYKCPASLENVEDETSNLYDLFGKLQAGWFSLIAKQ